MSRATGLPILLIGLLVVIPLALWAGYALVRQRLLSDLTAASPDVGGGIVGGAVDELSERTNNLLDDLGLPPLDL